MGDAPLSQDDIDAALNAAAGGGEADAVPESAADVATEAPADAAQEATAEAAAAEPSPPAEATAEEIAQDDIGELSQADIDAALSGGVVASSPPPVGGEDAGGGVLDDTAAAMAAAIAEERAAPAGQPPLGTPPHLPDFGDNGTADGFSQKIDLLHNVNLRVKIELGRTRMLVEEVLRLGPGSVVELNKLAGDPVDVFANDRLVAHGEVLVLNDNFCVRISEVVSNGAEQAVNS